MYQQPKQNPADITSKSCTVKMLNGHEFWWHGPTWLQKDHDNWPAWNVNILSKDIMDAISTENKGPKTIYVHLWLRRILPTISKKAEKKI